MDALEIVVGDQGGVVWRRPQNAFVCLRRLVQGSSPSLLVSRSEADLNVDIVDTNSFVIDT
jgi:hypothetical protein